jgi:transposase-like protein
MAAIRKSYTLAFKQKVLITLEEKDGNVSQTAREHNITRTHVQRWRNDKETILKAASPFRKRGRADSDSASPSLSPSVSARKRRRIR